MNHAHTHNPQKRRYPEPRNPNSHMRTQHIHNPMRRKRRNPAPVSTTPIPPIYSPNHNQVAHQILPLCVNLFRPRVQSPTPTRHGEQRRPERSTDQVTKRRTSRNALQISTSSSSSNSQLTEQANGSARGTPQTAPPRIDKYIDPGNENACKLDPLSTRFVLTSTTYYRYVIV